MGRHIAYRTYFILLCGIYLVIVFMFHGRLQVEIQPPRNTNLITKHEHGSFNSSYFSNHDKGRQLKYSLNGKQLVQSLSGTIHIKVVEKEKSCFMPPDSLKFEYLEVIPDLFYVYSSYLDRRYTYPVVRIMSLLRKNTKAKVKIHCSFSESKATNQSFASIYEMCENHNKKFGGYIISCPVPEGLKQPCKVSVKLELLDRNYISREVTVSTIKLEQEAAKYNFGICVPPLFGNIQKETIVEFIELTRILGAEHFIFYDFRILGLDIYRLLEYYIERKIVTVIPWKLPSVVSEPLIWYHGQLIAHNDCLYRSMSLMKVVGIMDMDEFVIPRNTTLSWKQVILPLLVGNVVGLSFQSAFFNPKYKMDDPSKLITAGSTVRSKQFSRVRTKVMVKPYDIFEVGIHHVSKPAMENYTILTVDSKKAVLHHYRKCMSNYGMKCMDRVTDDTALKYYKKLQSNFNNVLKNYRKS